MAKRTGKMQRPTMRRRRNPKGQFTKADKWMKHVLYYSNQGWTDLETGDQEFFARVGAEAFLISSFAEQAIAMYQKISTDKVDILGALQAIYGRNIVIKAMRLSTFCGNTNQMIARFADKDVREQYIISRGKASCYVRALEDGTFANPPPTIYAVPDSTYDTRIHIYFKEIPMQFNQSQKVSSVLMADPSIGKQFVEELKKMQGGAFGEILRGRY